MSDQLRGPKEGKHQVTLLGTKRRFEKGSSMNASTLRGSFAVASRLNNLQILAPLRTGGEPAGGVLLVLQARRSGSGPLDTDRLLGTFSCRHLAEKHREEPGLSLHCFCPSPQTTQEKRPMARLSEQACSSRSKRGRGGPCLFLSHGSPGVLHGMLGCAHSNCRCLLLLRPLLERWWSSAGAAAAGSAPGLSLTSHLLHSAPHPASAPTSSSPRLPPGIPTALGDHQR